MKNEDRQFAHQKPKDLEHALEYLTNQLGPLNEQWLADCELSEKPILFIVGCPRGGTTLLYQYLSYSGLFSYPTNFLSRFFFAPVLGARLQQMLFDFDFAGEVFPPELMSQTFDSHLGKTKGPLAPHEFWYFWRRFFQFGKDQATLSRPAKIEECFNEIRAFQAILDRPLVMKAMNLNWRLKEMSEAYQGANFLFVRRDLEANAQSLLRARKEFFGNEQSWYSFKPPGYESVLNQSPIDQTRWQVEQTNFSVEKCTALIDQARVFSVDFDDFRSKPKLLLSSICERWNLREPSWNHLPERF